MQQHNASSGAVWMAVNGPEGDRLLEITREHLRIVRELPVKPSGQMAQDLFRMERAILHAKIDALRAERDEIIARYEEGGFGA
ncbi:hypothetical protein [Paenibacillus herberti]|uniref:Uncharacterized protein n=1 Tax=Paenibacillus herberti TaxID=1619309 RepID=A0A229P0A2_9BACL|nr:hypothetical protein [Paenibacillus herberti]OXM15441.1 hypothetical protein CGZ75_01485 [Paenibacillus herberti]